VKGKKPACILLLTLLILGVATVNVAADPQPKIFVDPSTYTAARLGEVFTIDINISNVQNLVSFDFKLAYNTSLLDALDAVEGSFPQEPLLFQKVINDAEGYVWVVVGCGITSGNGTLAKITFKATFPLSASCPLDLYEVSLYDDNGDPIYPDVEDGNYEFVIKGITVETNKVTYKVNETVEIHGNLTLGTPPYQGLVALEVRNPLRTTVIRTLQAGTIPPPGNITIVDVVPCNAFGEPRQSFRVDSLCYFNITLMNSGTESEYVTICVNAYDPDMVSFDYSALYNVSVAPGVWPNIFIPSQYIPPWASIGNGTVYASALTDWPKDGGLPYCPEKSATFQITNGTLGARALETRGPGNAGDYNLTFKLAPNANTGVYKVFANCFYQGRYTTNTTVFGVETIGVPDHYSTIQGAVDAAIPTNNTIVVGPGTYNESATINKANLTLVGKNPFTNIINGGGTVVTATADNVKISRFTIRNSGSSPNSGIALNNSNKSTLSENIIISNSGYGININSSKNNKITENIVVCNNYGIYLNHSNSATLKDNNMILNGHNLGVFGDSNQEFIHDIDTSNSVNGKPVYYWTGKQNSEIPSNAGFVAIVNSIKIVVRGLKLTKNGQGVLLAFSSNCLIERATTINNEYGIYLVNSHNNTIIASSVSNNAVGIYQRYSTQNIICHNNFVDNTNQVDLYQSPTVTWDDGDGKGNYWSDYNGTDDGSNNRTAGDGVGDTDLPHQNVDWYPLMNPWTPVHDIAITSVTFILPYGASHIYPGWVIDITVTIKNEGDYTQTFFDINAYYNGTKIETKTITELLPQAETTINFTWDTKYVSPGAHGQNYTIRAVVPPISGETDTTDNTLIASNKVKVNLIGDVNNDGEVDTGDKIKLAMALWSEPGDPNFNPHADLNGDGEIDTGDKILVGRHLWEGSE